MIDWISAAAPLLAASDDAGLLASLWSGIVLWGRVALGIGLVIFVHELGHFVAAKTFGVKCEKFYVGFDVPIRIGPIRFPRTLGKFTYGETEYGIGILPLGGYVKMLGQDDDPRKAEQEAERIKVESGDVDTPPQLDPRSYPAKPVWQRMIIISAGVVMNVITGVLFAAIAFGSGVSYNPAVIGGVTPGGPAWHAAIEPGGQVIAVEGLKQEQMHFREMRMAILKKGLAKPDEPVSISIRYDDGVREYQLKTAPRPDDSDVRMIGISSPTSTWLDKETFAFPGTVAETVLGPEDAGGRIVTFDGNSINEQAIVPGTPLFDYLNSNPTKTIRLGIRRSDNAVHEVELPPQGAQSIGLRYQIGPIESLSINGPAEKAGLKVGDEIIAVNGEQTVDAYLVPQRLVGAKDDVALTIRRSEGESAETIELVITPDDSLQTVAPTDGLSGQIAINKLGFSFSPLPIVSQVIAADQSGSSGPGDTLQPGDELKEIRLAWDDKDVPENLRHERYEQHLEQLMGKEGWVFKPATSLSALRTAVQFLPLGTKLHVKAKRPSEDRVIQSTVTVVQDEGRVIFSRGLGLTATESIQKASSIPEALTLGMQEGKRRFFDVVEFLGMAARGNVKRKHVGGPLEIVRIAKSESEQGISRLLMFLTMLSMNLAILNFLPIPALDGGHMMFLLYEAVMGKRADEQIEFRLTLAGVVALLTLMLFVFANDLSRYF